ncbi:response regulator transcription factor [Patulibacter defluvii]|uniref:response regulator transcription factor n=1 Tax=Patulibacter defluvii TaxID=3095358 RepID=UPI002A762792|nr:response regulator transcription factor [Patulibacter sp. DM4]
MATSACWDDRTVERSGPDPAAAAGRADVLVVDDEPTVADLVARYLARAGFRTRVAHDGETALALVAERPPDLLVLDVMLPGIGGLEVLARVAERRPDPPAVILLTARGEEPDRITGLRRGADDYVVKPFSPGELVARVEAVLRRRDPAATAAPPLVHGPLTIDGAGRRVLLDGAEVAVTQRELDLLLFLARHPGQAFSRDQLMESVWGYGFYTDTSTVTVHVRRLRAKIEPDPTRPRFVQTVWGIGYRFQP